MSNEKNNKVFESLGKKVDGWNSPEEAVLERVALESPLLERATVRFSCPEFTSLCPVTNQPDFARIYIDFVPGKYTVESKSLKLFMSSFRNHGAFHEECTLYIAERLLKCLEPTWMRVSGIWYPRGGIPIDIHWQSGEQPRGLYIPAMKYFPYTGR